ncbi:MAG: FAD-dependent oxidoreductase [Ekhidna sp.]|nr:FAD-dependent oxidoreductase [Ekhidna sp.]
MQESNFDLIIVGAGLTGLTLGYLLRDSNISILIVEARAEIGGRIKTVRKGGNAPIEMGATWFGKKHTELNQLLHSLDIEVFEQRLGDHAIYEPLSTSPPQLVQLPRNDDDASYRIKGGTGTLITRLKQELGHNATLILNERVISIKKSEGQWNLKTTSSQFLGKKVVSTLPPYLLSKTISFEPSLPESLQKVMQTTHTWMGESIKIGLHYSKPFWLEKNTSGTIFSNVGPIPEMYDHSDFENQQFAIKGFLNGSYHGLTKSERLELILTQLRKYYGSIVDTYEEYEEKVWRDDSLTYHAYDEDLLPHQQNGNPIYKRVFFENGLYIAGSETASQFPGYMEGAIRSAKHIASVIEKK